MLLESQVNRGQSDNQTAPFVHRAKSRRRVFTLNKIGSPWLIVKVGKDFISSNSQGLEVILPMDWA